MPSCFSGEPPATYIYEAWTELVQLKWQNAKGDLVKNRKPTLYKNISTNRRMFQRLFRPIITFARLEKPGEGGLKPAFPAVNNPKLWISPE